MPGPNGLCTMAARQASKLCCGMTCVLRLHLHVVETACASCPHSPPATCRPMQSRTCAGSPVQDQCVG
eukprot:9417858-Lingulodinium_polyedra.AAC.1